MSRDIPRYQWRQYRQVKTWLIQRGFSMIKSSGKMNKEKMIGSITFSCGVSEIELIVRLVHNLNTGRLECGKVLRAHEIIYD